MSFRERPRPLRTTRPSLSWPAPSGFSRESFTAFWVLLASRSYTDPDLLSPAEIFFGDTRVRLVAVPSLVLPRMDGCDPMFSRALYEGLDTFARAEYDVYGAAVAIASMHVSFTPPCKHPAQVALRTLQDSRTKKSQRPA